MSHDIMLGPFSPQELDNLVIFLKENSINFEISKDEQLEKDGIGSTPMNDIQLLNRNKIYTGQIFFITIHKSDFLKIREQLVKLGISPDRNDDQSFENDHELGKPRFKRGRAFAYAFIGFNLLVLILAYWFSK